MYMNEQCEPYSKVAYVLGDIGTIDSIMVAKFHYYNYICIIIAETEYAHIHTLGLIWPSFYHHYHQHRITGRKKEKNLHKPHERAIKENDNE